MQILEEKKLFKQNEEETKFGELWLKKNQFGQVEPTLSATAPKYGMGSIIRLGTQLSWLEVDASWLSQGDRKIAFSILRAEPT